MIGLSGAYTTVASGYQSIGVNPANLASNNALNINLFSSNIFLVNDVWYSYMYLLLEKGCLVIFFFFKIYNLFQLQILYSRRSNLKNHSFETWCVHFELEFDHFWRDLHHES
jgi:hypothetical protein